MQNAYSCEKSTSSNQTSHEPQLLGIIGPSSSSSAIQVANILKLFNMPQMGYSASAIHLRDTIKYPYFSSVVPSDTFQAFLILKLLKHFNWTTVSVAYTDGEYCVVALPYGSMWTYSVLLFLDEYGRSGQDHFNKRREDFGICPPIFVPIPTFPAIEEYDQILERLSDKNNVKVVVCFCIESTVKDLLKAMKKFNFTGKFLLLGRLSLEVKSVWRCKL